MVCEYWTSTADGSTNAFDHGLGSYLGGVARFSINKSFGIGVRCIEDKPSGINESRNEGFEIFPNPTTDIVRITFSTTPIHNALVEIYNLQGNIVFSKPLNNTATIDLTGNPKGMYVVKVFADGMVYNEKVLIE